MDMESVHDMEKRKFPRLKENIFILASYRAEQENSFKAFTRDISAGGLMFEIERHIPTGSELELEIYQPVNRFKTVIFSVHAVAKAAWSKRIEKDAFEEGENRYQVGVEFLEIKDEDRQRILNFVNGMI